MNETTNALSKKQRTAQTESELFYEKAISEIKQYSKEENIAKASEIKESILDNCQKSMNERRVFKYGYCLILHYIFCWVRCRNEKSMRYKKHFRDQVYYNVGQEKLVDELDWVTIVKSIRRLKMLTQILLSKKQKFLLKFQRNDIIDSSSSGTSDEGQINIIDLMKSKSSNHKTIINDKIKRNLSSYKAKELKDNDIRIIRGKSLFGLFIGILKKRLSDDENENDDSFECSLSDWDYDDSLGKSAEGKQPPILLPSMTLLPTYVTYYLISHYKYCHREHL